MFVADRERQSRREKDNDRGTGVYMNEEGLGVSK